MKINSVLASLICVLSASVFAGDKIDETRDLSSADKIKIEVQRGNVEIKSWSENSFKVSGELDELAKGYELETRDGVLFFEVKMPRNKRHNWGSFFQHDNNSDGSQLVIYVPSKIDLGFEGVSTDLSVSHISGKTSVELVNGSVNASHLNARVNIETVNGEIISSTNSGRINLNTVNGKITDRDSTGKLEYSVVNGEIDVESDATDISASNVNGDMQLMLGKVDELEIETVNGEIDVEVTLNPSAKLEASSVSGDISLTFNGDVSAEFEIEAHAGGRIVNKLTSDKVKKHKYGPSRELEFEVNGGSARVELDTVSGTFVVKQ